MNLTPEQKEEIAELASQKTIEKVYMAVGKSVLNKLLFTVGIIVVAVAGYLKAKGIL